jgi:hypothetical protein
MYMTVTQYRNLLNRLVIALVGPQASAWWWTSPNKAFEDRTPESLMNETEWTRVRDYLMNHAYGGAYE